MTEKVVEETFINPLKYTIMNTKTNVSDFRFEFAGYGHYRVTYTSPKTGKSWSRTVDDMTIIDATKNSEDPMQKDLALLKRLIKRGY